VFNHPGCNSWVTQFKADAQNLIKHVKSCWGDTAYEAAVNCGHTNDARASVVKPLVTMGTITAAFERKGKGKVTYRHRQHMKRKQSELY
jgi:hypothetical protein